MFVGSKVACLSVYSALSASLNPKIPLDFKHSAGHFTLDVSLALLDHRTNWVQLTIDA